MDGQKRLQPHRQTTLDPHTGEYHILKSFACSLFRTVVITSVLTQAAHAANDLLGVYQMALSSDPQYRSAEAGNRAAQELRPQAMATLLPRVELNLSTTGNEQDIRRNDGGLRGKTHFNSTDFDLTATQPIYRKSLWIALEQANARIRQANAEFAFAQQDLMLRVSQRYFEVLRAVDELSFAQAARDAFQQQLEQSQQRFEVGLIAITDVEEAKAGFDLAQADVISAENELDNAREALREFTGAYHETLAGLGPDMQLVVPQPNDIETWTDVALAQNLRLAASRFAVEQSRDEIKRVASGHLPTIDLVGRHNRSSNGGLTGDSKTWTSQLSLQLNLPIYEGGLVLSQTRESRHLYQQSLEDMEQERRATERQTREAFLGVQAGISRVQALEQAVRSTQAAVEAIEAGFQVGTRTSVDVLDAERELFGAKRDFSAARYQFIVDILSLKQAAGTLSFEDLELVNVWLTDTQ